MSVINLLPLSSKCTLQHTLYNKKCNSVKLFTFRVGTMLSFPNRGCGKDTLGGRGFLQFPAEARETVSGMGVRMYTPVLPLPMAPTYSLCNVAASAWRCPVCRPLTHRNQRSYLDFTESACGPEGPHGCEAPSATPCSLHTAHQWPGVHREPLHNPPMQPVHSKGVCPHFCPESQCTHMSPVVNDMPPDLQALQNILCCLPSNSRQPPVWLNQPTLLLSGGQITASPIRSDCLPSLPFLLILEYHGEFSYVLQSLFRVNNSYFKFLLLNLLHSFRFLIGPRLLHQHSSYLIKQTSANLKN